MAMVSFFVSIPEEHADDAKAIAGLIRLVIEGEKTDITFIQCEIRERVRRMHGRASGIPQD